MSILARLFLFIIISIVSLSYYASADEETKYDYTSTIIHSYDNTHTAYTARTGDQWFVIIDNKESEPYSAIDSLAFSPDSKHAAYKAKKGDSWIVIIDNKEYNPYTDPDHIDFAPDGTKATIFYKDNKAWVISYTPMASQNTKTTKPEPENDKMSAGSYIVSGPYSGLGTGISIDYQFSRVFGTRFSYAGQSGVINNINWDGQIIGLGLYSQTEPWGILRGYGGLGFASVTVTGNNGGRGAAGGLAYFAGLKFAFTPHINLDIALNGLAQGITGGLDYIF